MQAIDLEEFKYSEVNITTFRMFSPQQPEVRKLITELGYPDDDEERNSKESFKKKNTQSFRSYVFK